MEDPIIMRAPTKFHNNYLFALVFFLLPLFGSCQNSEDELIRDFSSPSLRAEVSRKILSIDPSSFGLRDNLSYRIIYDREKMKNLESLVHGRIYGLHVYGNSTQLKAIKIYLSGGVSLVFGHDREFLKKSVFVDDSFFLIRSRTLDDRRPRVTPYLLARTCTVFSIVLFTESTDLRFGFPIGIELCFSSGRVDTLASLSPTFESDSDSRPSEDLG